MPNCSSFSRIRLPDIFVQDKQSSQCTHGCHTNAYYIHMYFNTIFDVYYDFLL